MGRVVLDEWHVRVEIDDDFGDLEAEAIAHRFASLIAEAARTIEDDLRALAGLGLVVTFER